MTLYDNVITSLKGVVGSRKEGVLLYYLENEYRSMTGEYFPLKRLGYSTMHEFINCHEKLFLLQGTGRYCRVFNVVGKIENDTTLNLISLIQNTQPKIRNNYYQPGHTYQSGYQNRPVSTLSWDDIRTNNMNMIIYQRPNLGYTPNKITGNLNKNLLVPTRCLLNAKTVRNKSDILVISDDNEPIVIIKPQVATQTFIYKSKTSNLSYFTFDSLALVNIIIDIIIDTKLFKNNETLNITINGDLYHHFRMLTGLNVEPLLFNDYVINAIESPKNPYRYYDLISLDSSKTNCLFDIKSECYGSTCLPDYEFGSGNYVVEIVKIFRDNLVAFKLINKLNPDLHWRKEKIPENTKLIIESQYFWSWIPGSLCLVQMPFSIVKSLKISPIERAVMIFTEIVTLDSGSLHLSQQYFIHKTSFYLIDHDIEVEGVLSCASSFLELKQNAKKNNDSDIAFVCSMSGAAKNTPSKIQFAKIKNFKDISDGFIDNNGQVKPKSMIVLKYIKKMAFVFHFQNVYFCSSNGYCDVEETRVLTDYKDIEIYQNGPIGNGIHDDCKDTDLYPKNTIKDDIGKSIKYAHLNFKDVCKADTVKEKTQNNYMNVEMNQKAVVQNHSQNDCKKAIQNEDKEIIVISDSEDESLDMIVSTHNAKLLSPINLTNLSESTCEIKNSFESPKANYQMNGASCIPNSSKTINNDKISIVSYSESDNDLESVDDIPIDSDWPNNCVSKPELSLPNSVISYLKNNSYPARKCLRPLTVDHTNIFHGKIVKLLHIQTGSAVIMLFDSIKFIRREIKMASLKKQNLTKAENVLVGDFFIWHQSNNDSNISDYFLVEVMQVVSKMSVLTNIVHQGLLIVVNINELLSLPDDSIGYIPSLIGPSIGAFDLHMFPDWFTPEESFEFSVQLYTAFFTDDGKLILEYFEEPCRFMNLEMIDSIEKSLTSNHCNVKSGHFIEMLAKSLVQCKLFVGNLLEMIEYVDENYDNLSITKVLKKVTANNKREVWFASVMVNGDCEDDCYEKLSPHNFLDDQFCIDRVIFDDRKQCLRVMDHQDVYVDVPDNCDGLYRFDRSQVHGSLTGCEEFLTRYMLAAAAHIPDLKYLYNKLIFDIHF